MKGTRLLMIGLVVVVYLINSSIAAAQETLQIVQCDVIVAGGSTAALAAALNAAKNAPEKKVCLIEPTDWPGGQMTSSAVSAIDFGNANVLKANQPKDFYEMLYTVGGDDNLGNCWVSDKCNIPFCSSALPHNILWLF